MQKVEGRERVLQDTQAQRWISGVVQRMHARERPKVLQEKGRVKRYYRYEERHRVVDGVKEKRCYRCKKWKAESEFYKRYSHKDGLAVWCKGCSDKAVIKSRKRRPAVRN